MEVVPDTHGELKEPSVSDDWLEDIAIYAAAELVLNGVPPDDAERLARKVVARLDEYGCLDDTWNLDT